MTTITTLDVQKAVQDTVADLETLLGKPAPTSLIKYPLQTYADWAGIPYNQFTQHINSRLYHVKTPNQWRLILTNLRLQGNSVKPYDRQLVTDVATLWVNAGGDAGGFHNLVPEIMKEIEGTERKEQAKHNQDIQQTENTLRGEI